MSNRNSGSTAVLKAAEISKKVCPVSTPISRYLAVEAIDSNIVLSRLADALDDTLDEALDMDLIAAEGRMGTHSVLRAPLAVVCVQAEYFEILNVIYAIEDAVIVGQN